MNTNSKLRWLNKESEDILYNGYIDKSISVEQRIENICNYVANDCLGKPELSPKFQEIIKNGWSSLSSPIWSNVATDKGMGISCVVGDTWINTNEGGKKAKDIKLGDLVLTHKNRFRKVTDIIPTKDKGDIYKLKVGTRMTNLYITGNHLVLTNLGWVRVDDLDKDKHLIAVNGEVEYDSSEYTIDLKEFVDYNFIIEDGKIKKSLESTNPKVLRKNKDETHNTSFATPFEKVEVDEDLAWALGLWFADGSLSTNDISKANGVRLTMGVDDEQTTLKWLGIMKDKFNLSGNLYKSELIRDGKEHNWFSININSIVIGAFFESFGKGCLVKTIPSWILSLPKPKLRKFLDGVLVGDGTPVKNGYSLTLSNPELLLGMYNIGLKLGEPMSLQMQSKASKMSSTSHVYRIVFREYKNSVSRNTASSGIPFSDGLTYCPIHLLEKTDMVEDVYDFTVEEDHSFSCAGVVVHNCFNSHVPDNLDSITSALSEVAIQTKMGGGTSGYFGDLRASGTVLSSGAKSSGAVSFIKWFESITQTVMQNGTRRGYFAAYLNIDHPEIEQFLRVKDPTSDIQDINTAVTIPEGWMEKMIEGDKEKRDVWAKVLESRRRKGIPYIFFDDNVNKSKPQVYKDKGIDIKSSNLCVAPYTQILTKQGYRDIYSYENQEVEVWNGEEWSEVIVKKTGTNQPIVRVKTNGGYELDCTPYHDFYVIKNYGEKEVKVKAKDLKVGDKLIKFELPIITGKKELKYAYGNGFYSGDGCLTDKGQRIYLYGEKKSLIENFDFINMWTEQPNQDRIYGHTTVLKDKFFVPNSEYSVKSRLDWLAGYADADGTITNNNGSQSLQIASIEKEFLKEVQLMLQTLGVDSKVTLNKVSGNRLLPLNDGSGELGEFYCKDVYRILINGNSLFKLSQMGFACKRLKWEVRKPNRECSHFIQIESVEKLPYNSDTYCFKEHKRGMGMFNGILTGQCSEVLLESNDDESFVCCLSSMNLELYDEWKDTDAVYLMTMFLDGIMTDFINKVKDVKHMVRNYNFAKNQRALGLGVLGYASLLQLRGIPFESLEAQQLNVEIFKLIQKETLRASKDLAKEYGEPTLMEGTGLRNVTNVALAPTTSSSAILGQVSPGIEPYFSNYYRVTLAKGSYMRKNKHLQKLLESKGQDTFEVWESVRLKQGSVQHLDFLSIEEKNVFKTFREISPVTIIQHASARQPYIDQGQSLNLVISSELPIKELNKLHIDAWKLGIKTLYYQRGVSTSKEKALELMDCSSCSA